MYNAHKVIILSNPFQLNSREGLQTIAIETHGLRVDSLILIDDEGSILSDKEAIIASLRNELFDDMYDEDTLKIKVREAFDGKDVAQILAKYIDKLWDEDLQCYYYEPDEEVYAALSSNLYDKNGRIYLTNYTDIVDAKSAGKDIKMIMKEQGLKTENMLEGSMVSFGYFLSALVEVILTR